MTTIGADYSLVYTKRQDIQDRIAEANDPQIFKQLVEHGKYNAEELTKLTTYIHGWVRTR